MQSVTPLLLYGIVTIIVALLSIFLPETKKRKLLEQVEDADHEESLETERWVHINVYDLIECWRKQWTVTFVLPVIFEWPL